jgi:epoxide hydrolase-like predicted phosphatase
MSNTLKIKWLLVDIGDVLLLKNRDRSKSFVELLAEELEVSLELSQKINKAHYSTMDIRYIAEEDFIAILKQDLDYDAPSDIYSYFSRAYATQVHPNTEFLKFLDEVRSQGIKTAVLSNTIAIYSQIQEEAGISLKDGFDPILYSWEVEMRKPDIEIFELALQKLDADPDEVVFIDDKDEHLQGARQVGLRTLLFENTESAISQIRTLVSQN